MDAELLQGLVDGWRERAAKLGADAAEKESGGAFRWAEWRRADMISEAITLRGCANVLEATIKPWCNKQTNKQ